MVDVDALATVGEDRAYKKPLFSFLPRRWNSPSLKDLLAAELHSPLPVAD